jgi:hypothetical protein
MEAADDEAVALPIEDRQGEALVAARLFERVVPNDADPPERLAQVALEDRRPGGQPIDVGDDGSDPLEVRAEHGFEALRVAAAGDRVEAAGQPTASTEEYERSHDEDHDGREEADDEGIEIGADEGVRVDRNGPRAVVRV